MKIKANKIHLLEFSSEPDGLNDDDFSHPVYDDLLIVVEQDERECLAFTDSEDIFIALPDYKVDKICRVFEKHDFIFTKKDITLDVLSGKIQKKYPEAEKLTPNFFNKFRLENTSIDDILDKIIDSGKESLDLIDHLVMRQ